LTEGAKIIAATCLRSALLFLPGIFQALPAGVLQPS
jgi:hypothetical protein